MHIFQVKIKKAHYLLVCLLLVILSSCGKKERAMVIPKDKQLEAIYLSRLDTCIAYLDSMTLASGKHDLLVNFQKARQQFKRIEVVMGFVERENYKTLNGPNILKVEEEDATDIKIRNPFGFQVLEELLFEDSLKIVEVHNIASKTRDRLQLIRNNTSLKLKSYHILWMVRDELARIALTGITGFDSPALTQSLPEAVMAYDGILEVVSLYETHFISTELYPKIVAEIKLAQAMLRDGNFNDFNRFAFIKNHINKQLRLLQEIKTDWNVEYPMELAFNNEMTSLFSSETFNMDFYSDYVEVDSLFPFKQELGKQLFNDHQLSATNTMSCATCHNSDKAFTDGLKTFPKQLRNTPTLTYAGLQQSFFYDGRTGNLEGQIVDVVNNNNEFHSNLANLQDVISKDSGYVTTFEKLYKNGVTQENVRNAIAVYVRGLGDFSSKFDHNINDLENTLTKSEINGFNLFMGKAKCATCHFPPVFNGTVPPYFTESEFELLGVPKDTITNVVDTDFGRYDVYQTEERKHFFKTPTVRNISKTAPYMHNGVYNTLHQVLVFYNNGGGAGLGMDLEYQTLPPDALNLTEQEMEDIVLFMNTLEDQ
ncbi:MAG: methylamine utilization protein [Aequorivita sp.]|nr:methylamine utilization protein [Aequorivita sp.]